MLGDKIEWLLDEFSDWPGLYGYRDIEKELEQLQEAVRERDELKTKIEKFSDALYDAQSKLEHAEEELQRCIDLNNESCDENENLKARVEELEEIIQNSEDAYYDMDADAQHWCDKYHQNEKHIELGKALELAYKSEEVEVFMFDGIFMVSYVNSDGESDELNYWYRNEVKNENN